MNREEPACYLHGAQIALVNLICVVSRSLSVRVGCWPSSGGRETSCSPLCSLFQQPGPPLGSTQLLERRELIRAIKKYSFFSLSCALMMLEKGRISAAKRAPPKSQVSGTSCSGRLNSCPTLLWRSNTLCPWRPRHLGPAPKSKSQPLGNSSLSRARPETPPFAGLR